MKYDSDLILKSLLIGITTLASVVEPLAQKKRVQQQERVSQAQPLVRVFRGRGKSQKDLPRAEKLEIGGDQIGQILQNETLVRLSARTLFVADRGYLIFRSGDSSHPPLHPQVSSGAEVNGLIGSARFNGLTNEIEIGVKLKPNRIYLLDVSVKHSPNCDRCGFSIVGPDHTESWDATQSETQHLYFTIITNDNDWYPLVLRGGTFEFDYCSVHEVRPV